MTTRAIRFPDDLWEPICIEAQHLGLSAGEFVREAATVRMAIARERRLRSGGMTLSMLYEAAHEYLLTGRAASPRP